MTPISTERLNMRRALETIRDLTGADIEQGPEIAETALEAIEHFAALRASPRVEFSEPDKAFEAWRDTLPDKHWAKHDLSACRLGWDAALSTAEARGLERAAKIVETALRDDFKRKTGQERGLSEAEAFLSRTIRAEARTLSHTHEVRE